MPSTISTWGNKSISRYIHHSTSLRAKMNVHLKDQTSSFHDPWQHSTRRYHYLPTESMLLVGQFYSESSIPWSTQTWHLYGYQAHDSYGSNLETWRDRPVPSALLSVCCVWGIIEWVWRCRNVFRPRRTWLPVESPMGLDLAGSFKVLVAFVSHINMCEENLKGWFESEQNNKSNS